MGQFLNWIAAAPMTEIVKMASGIAVFLAILGLGLGFAVERVAKAWRKSKWKH